MDNKPTLKDRRRTEAREALYRAQRRRDQIINDLVRNTARIKRMQRALARLDGPTLHTLAVSVAEGKILDDIAQELYDELNDAVPDLGGPR